MDTGASIDPTLCVAILTNPRDEIRLAEKKTDITGYRQLHTGIVKPSTWEQNSVIHSTSEKGRASSMTRTAQWAARGSQACRIEALHLEQNSKPW